MYIFGDFWVKSFEKFVVKYKNDFVVLLKTTYRWIKTFYKYIGRADKCKKIDTSAKHADFQEEQQY